MTINGKKHNFSYNINKSNEFIKIKLIFIKRKYKQQYFELNI